MHEPGKHVKWGQKASNKTPLIMIPFIDLFFKDFIYLFLDRGEGNE